MTADLTTMNAIVQKEYGSAPEDVLRISHVAQPAIGDDEVLARVASASVDRGTWHMMSGLQYPIRLSSGLRRPKALNPGRSFAGTVESIGKDVSDFRPGDAVYGICDGALAEYARARTRKIALKPANLTFEQASAVPISALTALQAVRDKAQVRSGQTVLIVGASGGVGSYAVQIAKQFGAEVTGVGSTEKVDLVRSLGADHVIDYCVHRFANYGGHYAVILDIGGNSPLSAPPARPRAGGAAGHNRRRVGRSLDLAHIGPPDPLPLSLAFHKPKITFGAGVRELQGPVGASRTHRGGTDQSNNRPDLHAQRDPISHSLPLGGPRARQDRRCRVIGVARRRALTVSLFG